MSQIILVDDDTTNISLTKMLLELDGFPVIACTTIKKAKESANKETQAFVIDIHLTRGTNGLDLLKDIRTGNTMAQKDTPIIITSGDHRREGESLEAGADLFLLKPYSPDILAKELHNLAAERGNNG